MDKATDLRAFDTVGAAPLRAGVAAFAVMIGAPLLASAVSDAAALEAGVLALISGLVVLHRQKRRALPALEGVALREIPTWAFLAIAACVLAPVLVLARVVDGEWLRTVLAVDAILLARYATQHATVRRSVKCLQTSESVDVTG